MFKSKKISKLKEEITKNFPNIKPVAYINDNDKGEVIIKFEPTSPDVYLNDHFEDMVVETLNIKGYKAHNFPGIGFIVVDLH